MVTGTPVTTTFGYTGDKLTSFGGTTIAYNAMGCPTTYEGKTATWSKGRLSRLFKGTLATGTSNYNYSYNALGQRVAKSYSYLAGTSGNNPVQAGQVTAYNKNFYYDHAGRLIAESGSKTYYGTGAESESIVYLYDENAIIGMEHTVGTATTRYYFQRNLLGDVVAIYNANGVLKAKYLYDAWGNCTISSETTDYVVANANPIRYRGYYYDDDTGLYYCNARYYSPKWRRFISPDDTTYLDPESVNGLNLYCYCGNAPITYSNGEKLPAFPHMSADRKPTIRHLAEINCLSAVRSQPNYLDVHWENKWLDTGWPGFMVLSQSGFEVFNWDLSIYNGSLYFDHDENHSIYVGVGNVGAYIGLHFEEGIGLDAGASVLVIGYDGRIIDASIEGLTVGITFMYKDGKFEFGYGAGWYGWSVSVDFIELFKVLLGGN